MTINATIPTVATIPVEFSSSMIIFPPFVSLSPTLKIRKAYCIGDNIHITCITYVIKYVITYDM